MVFLTDMGKVDVLHIFCNYTVICRKPRIIYFFHCSVVSSIYSWTIMKKDTLKGIFSSKQVYYNTVFYYSPCANRSEYFGNVVWSISLVSSKKMYYLRSSKCDNIYLLRLTIKILGYISKVFFSIILEFCNPQEGQTTNDERQTNKGR